MKPPDWLGTYPVLPIINQLTPDEALLIAEALTVGGVKIMEITLRTDKAKDSLLAVRKHFPELVLGAGSVMNQEQMNWIKGEGLNFAVSPGWSDLCWQKATSLELPFFPGILTPTELMHALHSGCLNPKIFPTAPVGGVQYLKSLLAPLRKCSIKCLPTGGIKPNMVLNYLNDPDVSMVGGSWITPEDLVSKKDFVGITELAKSSLLLANNN